MRTRTLETALEKVSRILSRKYGLRVVFEGESCKTNGSTIYLPSLPDDVPDELLGAIRGWCDHEIAHSLFTQTELGPPFQQEHGPKAFAILNSLEDGRVEGVISHRYPGCRLNLAEAFQFVSEKAKGLRHRPDFFQQFTSALYTRGSGKGDQDWIARAAYQLADEMQEELSALCCCRDTQQVADIALRIWEKLSAKFPQNQAPSEGAVASDDNESQAPGPSQHGCASPSERTPAEEGQGQAGGSGLMQRVNQTPMDALGSLIEQEVRRALSKGGSVYRVYTRQYDVVEVPETEKDFDYRSEMEKLRPYVAGVRRRLLQTLLGREEMRWIGDKTRGKLDPRSLHRLVNHASGRIFRQPVRTAGGNTACTLLLDVSASMRGAQIDLCRQLALIFAEVLDKLSFPTEVIAFSTVDKDLRYELAQQAGISEDELAKRYTRLVPLYHGLFRQFGEPWKRQPRGWGLCSPNALLRLENHSFLRPKGWHGGLRRERSYSASLTESP